MERVYANIKRVFFYYKKVRQLGAYDFSKRIYKKIKTKFRDVNLRRKAQAYNLHSSWQNIAKIHNITINFEDFFNNFKDKFDSQLIKFIVSKNTPEELIVQSDCYLKPLSLHEWHCDSNSHTNETNTCYFDKKIFYKDIEIKIGHDNNLIADIKVPWERSRLRFLLLLGFAYSETKNGKYSESFVQHVMSWQEANPFLLGVNWMCPIEVALRAINLVWAFLFFKNADISDEFWEKFFCLLYDHVIYLENNWELYDGRTNNHYLANLVGYFYLCWFFKDFSGFKEKLKWCSHALLEECDRQIFEEGATYEGSTAYHGFSTELIEHALFVARECLFTLKKLEEMYEKMRIFRNWCAVQNNNVIKIGDDDSSTVLHDNLLLQIKQKKITENVGIKHYKDFGISFIKTDKFHVSLRHHAYKKVQPTGHFHNDVGSITFNYDGIPIFIDPGSYIYTPSQKWRDYFRSSVVHNTSFIKGQEPLPFDHRLFAFDIIENNILENNCIKKDTKFFIQTKHNLYKRFNLQFSRAIQLDVSHKILTIDDTWESDYKDNQMAHRLCWNFTINPALRVYKEQQNIFFEYKGNKMAKLYSHNLDFKIESGWCSLKYSEKKACKILRVETELGLNNYFKIYIQII